MRPTTETSPSNAVKNLVVVCKKFDGINLRDSGLAEMLIQSDGMRKRGRTDRPTDCGRERCSQCSGLCAPWPWCRGSTYCTESAYEVIGRATVATADIYPTEYLLSLTYPALFASAPCFHCRQFLSRPQMFLELQFHF